MPRHVSTPAVTIVGGGLSGTLEVPEIRDQAVALAERIVRSMPSD